MTTDKEIVRVKAMAHPLRLQILKNLSKFKDPTPIKEIAKIIEEEPSKLHYHFKILEQAEIIAVTDTKIINGITEKYFSIVSTGDVNLSLKPNQEEVKDILPLMESAALDIVRRIPSIDINTDGPLYGIIRDLTMSKETAHLYKDAFDSLMKGKKASLPQVSEETSECDIDYDLMVFFVPKSKK